MEDAFDIASRFLDSGAKRNELELAILRHMEHHIKVEREACAKIAESVTDVDVIDVEALPTKSAELARHINEAWRKSAAVIASSIRSRT